MSQPSKTPKNRIVGAPRLDEAEAEFRLNSVWTGAWVTVIVCVPAFVYVLTVGARAGRTLALVDWGLALAGGFVALILPWRRIIASRWRELAFVTWTLLDLVAIGVAVVADGGPSSALSFLFFVPIVFVGASYPTWSVSFVCAIGLCAYAGLALVYGVPFGRALMLIGGLAGAALMSWWQARNHARHRRQLALASITDPLTGCLNRRGLDAAAEAALATLERADRPFALMVLDLDEFKAYNDRHGHLAGDALLRWTAEQIRRELRPTDTLARIGGDEFAVLVADSDAQMARSLAARIEAQCAQRVTHCTGIASAPESGRDFDALYRAADRSLYREKARRRALGGTIPGAARSYLPSP